MKTREKVWIRVVESCLRRDPNAEARVDYAMINAGLVLEGFDKLFGAKKGKKNEKDT